LLGKGPAVEFQSAQISVLRACNASREAKTHYHTGNAHARLLYAERDEFARTSILETAGSKKRHNSARAVRSAAARPCARHTVQCHGEVKDSARF